MSKKGIPLATCNDCKGNGETRGLSHWLICISCNGLGEVHADTGEALSDQNIIDRMRQQRRQFKKRIDELTNINRTPAPTTEALQRKWRGAAG